MVKKKKTLPLSSALMAAVVAPYAMNFVRGLMKEDAEISEIHLIVKRRRDC